MNRSNQLVMQSDPTPGKIYPVETAELILGRDQTCHLVINDVEVSRKHARLTCQENGECFIEDLGSTNGTFINDQRISVITRLNHGDQVSLGGKVILVFNSNFDPDATSLSAVSSAEKLVLKNLVEEKPISQPEEIQAAPSLPVEKVPVTPMPGPTKKPRGRVVFIVLLILLGCLCVALSFIIIRFLFNAPPQFWCDLLPFIYKPELYPQCIP